MGEYRYGVLLPHFGSAASKTRLLDGARRAEQLGFDSIWVRDHLVFRPHSFEDQDNTHVDPFVSMSAIAAVTDRITLATGSLIPHRHPIHTALLAGSLELIAGPGRLLFGWGLGTFQHEFDAAGIGDWDRKVLLQEQIEIMRKLWTGQRVTHDGTYYHFADVDVRPIPAEPIPTWYCGASLAAVRRAVEFCDGWIPGRMPIPDYLKRITRLHRLAEEAGKPCPDAGTIPYVVLGRDRKDALRHVPFQQMLAEVGQRYTAPNGGPFETPEDLDGALVFGTPDDVVAGVRRLNEAGAGHVVFDLRLQFQDFEDVLEQVGQEVLPALRKSAPRAAALA